VKHLTNLVTINLKENRLTSLPATLPSCKFLEYLCAAFNYITEVWFVFGLVISCLLVW
jgi:hypothetical protein